MTPHYKMTPADGAPVPVGDRMTCASAGCTEP
jgi:hypothetical protein